MSDKIKSTWEREIKITEKHIKTATDFQEIGNNILKQIKEYKGKNIEKIVKWYQQSMQCLEKGIKIERDAAQYLSTLYKNDPDLIEEDEEDDF